MNYNLHINILTHCDDIRYPKRFDILKKSIDSLEKIKREDVYISLWDNNSSENVKDYLKTKDFIDQKCFSEKNLYDLVAVHFLAEKSKQINAKYVCHLEDDFYWFYEDNSFLDSCFKFFDQNEDCGYLRILKYDFHNKEKYTKNSGHKDLDRSNCQTHKNTYSKQSLLWEICGSIDNFDYYKTNWIWYNFANICKADVFRQIIPSTDHEPLQRLEGKMMQNFNNLGLKVGVMNGGVVEHIGEFTTETSLRLAQNNHPKIKIQEVKEEIEKFLIL